MKKTRIIASLSIILAIIASVYGQQHTNNKADQVLRGSGRVNASTLGMELEIPLASYPGRGINIPISISYSSKVWRMKFSTTMPSQTDDGLCIAQHFPVYADNSASGWTTSLAVPYIEYTGFDNTFDQNGNPANSDDSSCLPPQEQPLPTPVSYIKRINIHLPGGENHELRDETGGYSGSSPAGFDGVYYAADGSNIKYVQDSANNFYRLQMPDGSYYDFTPELSSINMATARTAVKYTDRNGNFTSYNSANGTWTDTLGRVLTAPFGLKAPDAPTVRTYTMPGMTGGYKFHWKKLKGDSAQESGLTNFATPLRHYGDMYLNTSVRPVRFDRRADNTYLFYSIDNKWIIETPELFNPVVLTKIELPSGQIYRFSYDYYGRIEKINYPTGGEERFEYKALPTLAYAEPGNLNDQTNFGVKNRKVYPAAGQNTYYEWNYKAEETSSSGYKVTVINPDGTRTERYLHRSSNTAGHFGYDSALLGMAYREDVFSGSNRLISQKLTNWTVSEFSGGNVYHHGQWHPRPSSEETRIFDDAGNGVSATKTYEYDNLTGRDSPLLIKKETQYAFVAVGSPRPSSPLRTTETTYLINDPNYPDWIRNTFKNQNMIGLTTASMVRDGAGAIASRSETKYDDGDYSPAIGRGNPTNTRVWDSTKGNWDDPQAYLSTRAKFDLYGNQYETIDARGISTFTEYDSTHHAFPVKVTSAAPDPLGQHGSQEPFVTETLFDFVTGLPLMSKDANGLETRIEYDPATLRPRFSKTFFQNQQVGGMSETVYHDEPNNYWIKTRTLIDNGKWLENISYFDGLGRAYKTAEINSNGSIYVEKEFDEDGRVKRVTNPFRDDEIKQWTTNIYDEASRLREVILPDGARIGTSYGVLISDRIGVTKTVTDQAGKKRRGISDALGRMIRVIEDPDGQNLSTDYVFDALGNLRKAAQGEQNRYFSYDSLGRLRRAKQPEQDANPQLALPQPDQITGHNQWSAGYEYDNNGNITRTTDAKGIFVEGAYDNLNRLKFRNYADQTSDVTFYYDGIYIDQGNTRRMATGSAKGKTTGIRSSVSTTNYTNFDQLGRLLASQQITDGKTYNFGYEYNLTALVAESYPSGRRIFYELDQNGDLARVAGQIGNNSTTYANSFTYNSAGAVESLRLGNGRWEIARYNNRQQIVRIGLGSSAADASLLQIDYDYGTSSQNNGSLRRQRINFSGLPGEIVQNYTYDDLNRLKSAAETFNNGTLSWKQTFSYDRYGNRTFDGANTTTLSPSASPKVTNPTIQTADNRLKKDQDNDNIVDYDYDQNGSVTLDAENKRFIYDAENRLKVFFNGTNSSATPDAEYFYDGSGQRVKKKTADETVIFVYNAGGTLAAEYSTTPAERSKVSYLTADHLGSPRIITDGAGMVVSRHDYLAFGDEVTETLGNIAGRTAAQGYGAEDEIRKQYTGYERDEESGLDYAKARYYNSKHGRFTSPDPYMPSAVTEIPQSWNRYTYVLNKPFTYIDPNGEDWVKTKDKENPYKWVDKCGAGQKDCFKVVSANVNGNLRVYGSKNENDVTNYEANNSGMIDMREVAKHHDAEFVVKSGSGGNYEPYLNAKTGSALFNVAYQYSQLYPNDEKLMMTAGSREDGTPAPIHKSHRQGNNMDLRYMGPDGRTIQSPTAYNSADVERTKTLIKLFKEQNAGLDAVITGEPPKFGLPDIKNQDLKNVHKNHMHFQRTYPQTVQERPGRQE